MNNPWQTTDFDFFCKPEPYKKTFPIVRINLAQRLSEGSPCSAGLFLNRLTEFRILRVKDGIEFSVYFNDFNKGIVEKFNGNNLTQEFEFENEEQFMNILTKD